MSVCSKAACFSYPDATALSHMDQGEKVIINKKDYVEDNTLVGGSICPFM